MSEAVTYWIQVGTVVNEDQGVPSYEGYIGSDGLYRSKLATYYGTPFSSREDAIEAAKAYALHHLRDAEHSVKKWAAICKNMGCEL